MNLLLCITEVKCVLIDDIIVYHSRGVNQILMQIHWKEEERAKCSHMSYQDPLEAVSFVQAHLSPMLISLLSGKGPLCTAWEQHLEDVSVLTSELFSTWFCID